MNQVKKMTAGATFVFSLLTALFVSRSIASKKQDLPVAGNGFAVLELFTSEGCSSCPPADALLARIQQEAGNKPIYILAYHVDYWNRLGWKDIFSSPQYSKRQYQYSQQLTGQVYTPQLIINGKASCIGSDEAAVSGNLANALGGDAPLRLDIRGALQPGKVQLHYTVTGDVRNSELLVAVVQKHAVSKVARGENEGRTLSHVQIVRDLQTFRVSADKQGTAAINLPDDFNTQEWELIGMIQQRDAGVINAATRVVAGN